MVCNQNLQKLLLNVEVIDLMNKMKNVDNLNWIAYLKLVVFVMFTQHVSGHDINAIAVDCKVAFVVRNIL